MTGVYIHIPYCKRKCFYCSFVSFCDFSDMPVYVNCLISEIEKRAKGELIDTVYIGGGTPSVLFSGAIKSIMDTIRTCFSVQKDAEITIEANPDSVTSSFVDECVMSGINRVSMGLQTANNDELSAIGRLHDRDSFENAYKLLRRKGIENINVDLMLGIPNQDTVSAIKSAEYALSLNPEHISIYSLSLEPGCNLYGKYIPNEDLSAELYTVISELLIKRGYERYEVSNFAKFGKLSRHNYKYWTGEDYYGFGTAAHSLLAGIRYENPDNNNDYFSSVEPKKTVLTLQDKTEEFIMLRMRTEVGINLDEFYNKFGYRLDCRKQKEIDYLKSLDLVETGENLRLTDKGFYVMNQIIIRLI